MISTQLKKCLVVSASTISALGLMVMIPHTAVAQTSSDRQIGVEGSQANPGSTDGTGQVIAPSVTTESSPTGNKPGMMTPSTNNGASTAMPDMSPDMNDSDTGRAPSATEGTNMPGMMTPSMNGGTGTATPDMSPDMNDSDTGRAPAVTEGESSTTQRSITVPDSSMPSNTVPTPTSPSRTTSPTTTSPSRTTSPSTTTSPNYSNTTSPRALW